MSYAQFYRVSSIRHECHTSADSSPAITHQKEIILMADPSSVVAAVPHDARLWVGLVLFVAVTWMEAQSCLCSLWALVEALVADQRETS